MVGMTAEDFCVAYRADPNQALKSLQSIPEEDAAAILIDAGDMISEIYLLNKGISRFEGLLESEGESPFRSYCIANGKHLRASINSAHNGPNNEGVLDDLFAARIEHAKVLSGESSSRDLPSRSATNFGNLLLQTGRWVEALDFFQRARSI